MWATRFCSFWRFCSIHILSCNSQTGALPNNWRCSEECRMVQKFLMPLIQPKAEEIFPQTLLMCLFQLKFSSMCMPRDFIEDTCSMETFFLIYFFLFFIYFLLHCSQLQYLHKFHYNTTNSLNIIKQYLRYIINITNSHSLAYTNSRTCLHSKVTPIWAWHVLSYSTTSNIHIAHFFLNISKILFFVQMYFSVSYFNLTFDLKRHTLGSSLFLLHVHK